MVSPNSTADYVTVSGVLYGRMYNPDLAELPGEHWDSITITPLQQVLGFPASEEVYDQLPTRDQLILDLLMAGWNQSQIAKALGISQPTISTRQKQIRYQLSNTQLRLMLEMRMERYG